MLDKYLKGSMPGADNALRIADALGVSMRWLVTGEGPERSGNASLVADAGEVDWVLLPRYDLAGFTPEAKPQPMETVPVAKHWLNRNWYASTGLWLTAMPPTHHEGMPAEGDDILIRDATVRTDAGTYLYLYNGVPLVRRWTDSNADWGGSPLKSELDGVSAPRQAYQFDEPEGMRIVGRVLGSIKVNPL